MRITIGALLLALSAPVLAEEPAELRIALVLPYSSSIRSIAQDIANGASMGMENTASRLPKLPGGHPLKVTIDFLDDHADLTVATRVANDIVASGKYQAVIGGYNSGTAIPSARIFEQAGLINISVGATNPRLTRVGHKWVFRMSMDDDHLARSAYRTLAPRLGGTPAFFVYDSTAYGQYTAEAFAGEHQAATGQAEKVHSVALSGDDELPPSIQDFSGDRAVLYLGGMDLFGAKVIEKLPRNVHWTLVGGDGLCSTTMVKAVARQRMNLICASQEKKDIDATTEPSFVEAYKARFHQPPGSDAAIAYNAVALLMDVFWHTGTMDTDRARRILRSGQRFAGIDGDVIFDAVGDNSRAAAYLYEAEGGELQLRTVLH